MKLWKIENLKRMIFQDELPFTMRLCRAHFFVKSELKEKLKEQMRCVFFKKTMQNKMDAEVMRTWADRGLLGLLTVTLIGHYFGLSANAWDQWTLIVLSCAATIPVAWSAVRALRERKITVDLLASVALVVSMLSREWASAAFINLMLTCARIFDAYTEVRAKRAIQSLLKLRPERVRVKRNGAIVEEAVSSVVVGDEIIVELGERVPVDGSVLAGQAQLDQSSLTGESLPVEKGVGNEVLSSTLVASGSLVIRAEKVGEDTTFEKVVQLVAAAQQEKAGIQTTADRFAGWYIAGMFALAVGVFLVARDMHLVLSVLLVTCADDIAVAIPMAFSAGIAVAARHGIIFKGGSFLEGLTRVRTLIVDKTGTITKGNLHVERVLIFGKHAETEVVSTAASAGFFSAHPVARAVVRFAEERKIAFEKTETFEEHSGKGTHAIVSGIKFLCGKISFLREEGVDISAETERRIDEIRNESAGSVLPVARGGECIGCIVLEDEVRGEAKRAIEQLRTMGVTRTIMLTGDNERVAERVCKKAGIDEFHANLLPEDKLKYVRLCVGKKGKVAMVGDGVNDAASLSLADIGVAMGAAGTDAAIEAADVALMRDDFSKLPEAMALGKRVVRICKQNFWMWGSVNVVGLILVFGNVIGPEGAAAYNFLTDFLPIANAMRVFGGK